MLSVLIPVYNYDIVELVKEIHHQLQKSSISFEIICLDDCSTNPSIENFSINELSNSSYAVLKKNIGRSAIRNLLAENASYENLLFLDADTKVINNDFIEVYLNAITPEIKILYGGIKYQKEAPSNVELLRWIYGTEREALDLSTRTKAPHLRFLTLNFVIKKSLFGQLKFNESIPNMRHEDTLFAVDAKRMGISVTHLDNPILHLGLETSEVFLKKSEEACEALRTFVQNGLIKAEDTSLSHTANTIAKLHATWLFIMLFKLFKPGMTHNLLSAHPSLFLFDVYRLGSYCSLKPKN